MAGQQFADNADLEEQQAKWLALVNGRPSRATDTAPNDRLTKEAAKGGALPGMASDYSVLRPG